MRENSLVFHASKIETHNRQQTKNFSTPASAAILVLETGEGSYSRFDPSLLIGAARVVDKVRPVRGQIDPHYEVRRVPGC